MSLNQESNQITNQFRFTCSLTKSKKFLLQLEFQICYNYSSFNVLVIEEYRNLTGVATLSQGFSRTCYIEPRILFSSIKRSLS